MAILVPRPLLPDDAEERRRALRDYFCDKDATAVGHPDGWELSLDWAADPARYIDPVLDRGLAWWGTDVAGIPLARRREGRTTFSLLDSWGLHSWSLWLAAGGAAAAVTAGGLTVLHVDDHSDLMPPRLLLADSGWSDLITGRRFDLFEPDTVASAIGSGAVGMGSFATPLASFGVPVEWRHLRQGRGTLRGTIVATTVADTLLRPGGPRPAVEMREGPAAAASRVLQTDDVDLWLADLPPRPALLHIDLDYFCNRFNGDTDWEQAPARLDTPLPEVAAALEVLLERVRASPAAGLIVDVAVAYSPGFFPAELWHPIDGVLRRGLASLGAL